ncbi:MAG: prepilin-type N-terminal cleavage/methylation domain-containing protein [Phycisphaeraceae bacterium]|nr:prepilin-type N-terminal cleavage/methylation domain-containing protein [Phycisphaeraceae bacterium]
MSNGHRRDWAFSLIEVLAALVILGSLLSAVVVARGRFIHQSALARQRLEAVTLTDQLLEGWWQDLDTLPRDGSGVIGDYRWQTQTEQRDDLDKLNVNLLTLTLWRTPTSTVESTTTSDGEGKQQVLVIRLLVPEPEESGETGSQPMETRARQKAAST